jgi:hypothetical protein
MDQSAAEPATHVPHLRTRGKPEEVDAVLDHPVAPESAIDESQRIVVVPDLIGRDGHGGHQISKRAGEKAERS